MTNSGEYRGLEKEAAALRANLLLAKEQYDRVVDAGTPSSKWASGEEYAQELADLKDENQELKIRLEEGRRCYDKLVEGLAAVEEVRGRATMKTFADAVAGKAVQAPKNQVPRHLLIVRPNVGVEIGKVREEMLANRNFSNISAKVSRIKSGDKQITMELDGEEDIGEKGEKEETPIDNYKCS